MIISNDSDLLEPIKWRFWPAMQDGKAIRSSASYDVNFRLPSPRKSRARSSDVARASALPGESQRAAEKRGQTLGFLRGRAAHPLRRVDEWLDRDFDAAALDFVPPDALHAAIDQ